MLYDKRWENQKVELEPWRRILLGAADLIEQKGWVQCIWGTPDSGYCALGAVNVIASAHEWRAKHEATQHLVTQISTGDVTNWNDRPERTKAEVIAMLRAAADAT